MPRLRKTIRICPFHMYPKSSRSTNQRSKRIHEDNQQTVKSLPNGVFPHQIILHGKQSNLFVFIWWIELREETFIDQRSRTHWQKTSRSEPLKSLLQQDHWRRRGHLEFSFVGSRRFNSHRQCRH